MCLRRPAPLLRRRQAIHPSGNCSGGFVGGGEMSDMPRVIFAVCVLLGPGRVAAQPPAYESFENGIPAYITAPRAGSLSVSPWHNKHGKNSLRWEWSKGEDILIRHDIGDVSRAGGFLNKPAFVVWMYL